MPLTSRLIIDSLVARDRTFLYAIVFLAGLQLVSAVARRLLTLMGAGLNRRGLCYLNQHLFDKALSRDLPTDMRKSTGDTYTTIVGDSERAFGFVRDLIPNISGVISRFIGTIVAFTLLDPLLLVIAAIGWLPFVIAQEKRIGGLVKMMEEGRVHTGQLNDVVYDLLGKLLEIKGFSARRWAGAEFGKAHEAVLDNRLHVSQYQVNTDSILSLLSIVRDVALILVGAVRVYNGNISIGTLTAVLAYERSLIQPFTYILDVRRDFRQRDPSIRRVVDLWHQSPASQTLQRLPQGDSGVHVIEVAVQGAEQRGPRLRAASSQFLPGTVTTIIGENGQGKSTLCLVICGLVRPSSGIVSVLGHDSQSHHWRDCFPSTLLIPQGARLFRGTIMQNLCLGKPVDQAEIWRCLDIVEMASRVRELPGTLDWFLGSNQDGLSGGEQQRILIARALLSRPSLLVMDETMSGIPSDERVRILADIRRLVCGPGGIVIVVSHDDRIAELSDAVVRVDNGLTHQVRMRPSGVGGGLNRRCVP